MEVKRDILWRVYLCYLAVVLIGILIIGKAFYIQNVQGSYWRGLSDSLHEYIEETEAERGTIYSEDGQMLSTSIPRFDVFIDFMAEGLTEKKGKRFWENVDSLSYCLSNLFKDKTEADYRKMLVDGFEQGRRDKRHVLLKRKVSFREYQQMQKFPLVRLGKNKSGFKAEAKSIRLNPYQMLAFRTIGLDRDSFKVGLEMSYDSMLNGVKGRRLVKDVGEGIKIPVDESMEIEPENGKDVITTLDVQVQELAESALMKMMKENEAQTGCVIVMEVKTGKIKAMVNLGRQNDGTYWEDLNYCLMPTEPGSTFKLATMLSVLEDNKCSLNSLVNLQGGTWSVAGRTVYDSENHGLNEVSVKRAFELSSNVGMAKIALASYENTPQQFVQHLERLGFTQRTSIDLAGERNPMIYKPGSRYWSATTLPWMAFGYNVAITPLHTTMLYNAIANKGVMMKPYLVGSIQQNGKIFRQIDPVIVHEKICKEKTLRDLTECLKGVCSLPGSTGYMMCKDAPYQIAGKTGTALVANGSRGYADGIYQSSFAGFFPANDPQYTCVVVIKNKPHAAKYYGAAVAGPVFREIADRLYAKYVKANNTGNTNANALRKDSSRYSYFLSDKDAKTVLKTLRVPFIDSARNSEWVNVYNYSMSPVVAEYTVDETHMPQLIGMTLKDAVYTCENRGLNVNVKGSGRVKMQSIPASVVFAKGQKVQLVMDN